MFKLVRTFDEIASCMVKPKDDEDEIVNLSYPVSFMLNLLFFIYVIVPYLNFNELCFVIQKSMFIL
jgi:hypothetical protein